ncbi:MAG: Zn-dependent protease [bacterium]|nr:Zn-dependent protease [bacterium]
MRKKNKIYIILISALLLSSLLAAAESKVVVAVQPFGKINKKIVAVVAAGIEKVYTVEVVILPRKKLPANAYYPPRKRYRAGKILDYLSGIVKPEQTKIVGLTKRDISTTKGKFYDWGIFGLGTIDNKPCVVSTFRLRRGRVSEAFFRGRLIKVVNHELGHTFGIPHCPSKGCLMQDARGTIKTVDAESGAFCETCKEHLKGLLR